MYKRQNQLTGIVETRGGTTKLAYGGTTVTITPPFSNGTQQTTLTLDQVGGHATSIQTPAGETTKLTYSNGLMASFIDPKSNLHTFTYDALGRLIQDTDPTAASILLQSTMPVSYTHLDVYKRQGRPNPCFTLCRPDSTLRCANPGVPNGRQS